MREGGSRGEDSHINKSYLQRKIKTPKANPSYTKISLGFIKNSKRDGLKKNPIA